MASNRFILLVMSEALSRSCATLLRACSSVDKGAPEGGCPSKRATSALQGPRRSRRSPARCWRVVGWVMLLNCSTAWRIASSLGFVAPSCSCRCSAEFARVFALIGGEIEKNSRRARARFFI